MFNKFIKDFQLIADINNFRDLPYLCKIAGTDEEVRQARQLQAEIYLRKGNIHKDQITKEGVLDEKTDAYSAHSTYFIVTRTDEDGRVVGAARQINHRDDMGFDSFQIFSKAKISPQGTTFINNYDANKTVEISGLVKSPGEALIIPMYLYRQMWRYSLLKHHKLWVMVMTDHLYYRLKPMFGKVIREVGGKHQLSHSNNHIVPAAVEIEKVQDVLENEIKESTAARKIILQKLHSFFFTEV